MSPEINIASISQEKLLYSICPKKGFYVQPLRLYGHENVCASVTVYIMRILLPKLFLFQSA